MGVAAVGSSHASVRRTTGSAGAGLLAGAALALTPVAALMFRFNNPDALLTLLLMVGATQRVLEAINHPRGDRLLLPAAALVGFAFLTKMLQAFLVLPAFALVYLLFAAAPPHAASGTCSPPSVPWSSPAAGGSRSCRCGRPARGPTSAARRTTPSSSSPSATTASAG